MAYLGFDNLEKVSGLVYIKISKTCSMTVTEIESLLKHITNSTTNNIAITLKNCGGILLVHLL